MNNFFETEEHHKARLEDKKMNKKGCGKNHIGKDLQTIGDGMNEGIIINPLGKNQSQELNVEGQIVANTPYTECEPRTASVIPDTQICANCGKPEAKTWKDNDCCICHNFGGKFKPQIPQTKPTSPVKTAQDCNPDASTELNALKGLKDKTEETEMSGSLDSNSGTLNPNVSGFFSKEIEEVEKEIEEKSNQSCWSLTVEKLDYDTGDCYNVWSQIFDTEEQLDNFLNKHSDWKNEDEGYGYEKRFIEKIQGYEVEGLKTKLKTLKLVQAEEKKKHDSFVEKLNGIIDEWYIQNIKSAIRIDKEIIILKKEIDKLLEEME